MMKVITNRRAKSIMIRSGEVRHRNDNHKVLILEAMHAHVKNVHVIDNKMRLRREDGVLALFHKVQVPLRHGIRQDGLLLVLQLGGLTDVANERHQRFLIRKEDFLCITGFLSSL